MVVEGVTAIDPTVAAGVALVVAALVGGALAHRRVTRPAGVRLRRVLDRRETVTVLLHPNPDPDAMACAMGVAAIAADVDTAVTVRHPGEIRHQSNRAFKALLELELERIAGTEDLGERPVVLVDHNTARGFPGAQSVEPIAVIDHHPGNGTGSSFTDVRPDYGAAATIVAEYLEELGAAVDEDDDEGLAVTAELATGLAYGILADTDDLTTGCTPAEFAALAYLHEGIDRTLLRRISDPEVSEEVLQTKAKAIRDRRVEGPFAVCDLEEVPAVDAISQAADELVRLEGVTAVVAYGESNGTVHLSGRSWDDRIHMGEALESAVEDIPMADAGGHRRMGGGQLSVDHMNGIGPSGGISKAELEDRLLSALDGDVT